MKTLSLRGLSRDAPGLEEAVLVTTLGKVIGHYFPVGVPWVDERGVDRTDPDQTRPTIAEKGIGPGLVDPSVKATGGPTYVSVGKFPPAKDWDKPVIPGQGVSGGSFGASKPAPKPGKKK